MRRVYIAHPLRGERLDIAEMERNVSRVTEICRHVAEEHPDVLILSPIHAFDFVSPLESSIVEILTSGVLSSDNTLNKLVDFPEPVGPVTKIIPFGCAMASFTVASDNPQ